MLVFGHSHRSLADFEKLQPEVEIATSRKLHSKLIYKFTASLISSWNLAAMRGKFVPKTQHVYFVLPHLGQHKSPDLLVLGGGSRGLRWGFKESTTNDNYYSNESKSYHFCCCYCYYFSYYYYHYYWLLVVGVALRWLVLILNVLLTKIMHFGQNSF